MPPRSLIHCSNTSAAPGMFGYGATWLSTGASVMTLIGSPDGAVSDFGISTDWSWSEPSPLLLPPLGVSVPESPESAAVVVGAGVTGRGPCRRLARGGGGAGGGRRRSAAVVVIVTARGQHERCGDRQPEQHPPPGARSNRRTTRRHLVKPPGLPRTSSRARPSRNVTCGLAPSPIRSTRRSPRRGAGPVEAAPGPRYGDRTHWGSSWHRAVLAGRAAHESKGPPRMKMKAAILWKPQTDWSVEEVELDPPKAG